jgi:hypothetical protein
MGSNDKYIPKWADSIIVNGIEFQSKNQACYHYGVSWSAVSSRMRKGCNLEEGIRALRKHKGLSMLNPHHLNLICAKSWGCNETTTLAKLTQGRRT